MVAIEHPLSFMTGCRMMMLKGRHKDGVSEQRAILRISHNADQFHGNMQNLLGLMQPGERIYASAGERHMQKAIRLFKERLLAADYDEDSELFYRHIEARWTSCLMDPKAQADKLWMFDCDTAEDTGMVRGELVLHYDRPQPPYEYQTRSGHHIIVLPFDRSKLSGRVRGLIHENPLMLWAY